MYMVNKLRQIEEIRASEDRKASSHTFVSSPLTQHHELRTFIDYYNNYKPVRLLISRRDAAF